MLSAQPLARPLQSPDNSGPYQSGRNKTGQHQTGHCPTTWRRSPLHCALWLALTPVFGHAADHAGTTTLPGQPAAHQPVTHDTTTSQATNKGSGRHAGSNPANNTDSKTDSSANRQAKAPANSPVKLATVVVKASPLLQLQQSSSTAGRLGLSQLQTPASVDTQQEAQWQRRADVTVRDIVARSTGISDISNLGTGNAFSARGFTGNNSVAQAEDGIRLQTAASTLTFPGDSWGYQKVEVLRGPASVLYGDGSVGGIINSIRKAPSARQELEGRLLLGSDAAQQLALGGSGALHDNISSRVDVSARKGDGPVQRGDYQGAKLMSGVAWQASEQLQLRLTADGAYDTPTQYTGVPLQNGQLDERLKDINLNISDGIQRFKDERYRLQADYQFGEASLSNSLHYSGSDRHWRNLEYFSFVSADLIERSGYTEIRHLQQQRGNRLSLTTPYQLGNLPARLNVGHEYSDVDFRYFDNFYNGNDPVSRVSLSQFEPGLFQTIDPTVLDFTAQSRQQALFVDHQLQLSPALSLVQGLRYDEIRLSHQSQLGRGSFSQDYAPLAWRFGAVYQRSANQSLYAQFSQGSDPVSSLISLRPANSAFRLTRARQLELGYKQQWSQQAEFSAALFHIDKNHILTRDPNDPRLRVQGGSQSSRGIELSGRLLLSSHWQAELNASLLQARYDQLLEAGGVSRAGQRPVNVPNSTANAWLYYQQEQWQFAAGLKYVSARYADTANTARMAGYLLTDLSASWQLNTHNSLQLSVKNLTDRLYVPVSYDYQQVIIGPGRAVTLQWDLQF